jgi:hypothetical protein
VARPIVSGYSSSKNRVKDAAAGAVRSQAASAGRALSEAFAWRGRHGCQLTTAQIVTAARIKLRNTNALFSSIRHGPLPVQAHRSMRKCCAESASRR